MILNPQGTVIAETCETRGELLMAEIDLQDCVVPKQFHDLSGYYNRFDIFRFSVDRRRLAPIEFAGADAASSSLSYDMLEAEQARPDAAE